MKKKIQLLSKGIFECENPEIEISVKTLHLEVEYEKKQTGSFNIRSLNNKEIRALIFSNEKSLKILNATFIGEVGTVSYCVDTKDLEIGDIVQGKIYIVSNGGEFEVPFSIEICAPFFMTSIGKISELDQFVDLSKENWEEALKLFNSDEFRRVFLQNKKNLDIYEALIQHRNLPQNLEEFLCTIRRKDTVKLSVLQNNFAYKHADTVISDRLVIEKSTWGHIQIQVKTEGDFLTVYKNRIVEDDFLGRYYQLEFQVQPQPILELKGKIILETFNQRIEVPVVCQHTEHDMKMKSERKSLKHAVLAFHKNNRQYFLNKITKERWLSLNRYEIDCCLNNSSDVIYRVMDADYYCLIEDYNEAQKLLAMINGMDLRYRSPEYYSYYLFVNAKAKQDEHYTQYVQDTIQYYLERLQNHKWNLLWMLMQLDERKKEHSAYYYRLIKNISEKEAPNALIYAEIMEMINRSPIMIREMGRFEVSVFLWGYRHGMLSRELVYQFAENISRMRYFHTQCLNVIKTYCHLYESKQLLTAVLHLMILGDCKSVEDHEWYKMGIQSSLRMPELYEYYIETIDEKAEEEIPISVLIYFQYDNRLSEHKKSFLYWYVVKHRNEVPKIYQFYEGFIKAFVLQQLEKRQMNQYMGELYALFLTDNLLTSKVLGELPDIIFKHMLVLNKTYDNLAGVLVSYSEIERELYYEFEGTNAYIDLFMDNYRIIFVDYEGNRYMSSVDYEIIKMMDTAHYAKLCYDADIDQEMILLNRSERVLKYQMLNDQSIEVYKKTLKLPHINQNYQESILKNIIDYYDDNYEGETLEKYLLQIDIQLLGHNERSHIIDFFIQRGLFEKAYDAIAKYGYLGIQDKRIMRLCSRMIKHRQFERDDLLIELAYYTFKKGKYDEVILEYLINYYLGTVDELYVIWKAASDFEVKATVLEERLICEVLFAECHLKKGCDVFASYYHHKPLDKIVQAFLAYCAHITILSDDLLPESIYHMMEIELEQLKMVKDVCNLALLKYYAQFSEYNNLDQQWIATTICQLADHGLTMPYFKQFAYVEGVPTELIDMTYVVCKASKDANIRIFYRMNDTSEYIHEPMRHVYGGLFIKKFRLYTNEQISYYIVNTENDREVILEQEKTVRYEGEHHQSMITGVDEVNCMIDYLAFYDQYTLSQAIKKYDRQDAMVDQLFELR